MKHEVVVIDITTGSHTVIPSEEETEQKSIVAAYDRRGDHIFTGNERGKVSMRFTDSPTAVASNFWVVSFACFTLLLRCRGYAQCGWANNKWAVVSQFASSLPNSEDGTRMTCSGNSGLCCLWDLFGTGSWHKLAIYLPKQERWQIISCQSVLMRNSRTLLLRRLAQSRRFGLINTFPVGRGYGYGVMAEPRNIHSSWTGHLLPQSLHSYCDLYL